MKFRRFSALSLLFGLSPSFSSAKDHGLCTEYFGTAKGLCVAYCVVKECHLKEIFANKGCAKLKKKFQRITGETLFPCEEKPPAPTCPCWTEDYLDQAVEYYSSGTKSVSIHFITFPDDKQLAQTGFGSPVPGDPIYLRAAETIDGHDCFSKVTSSPIAIDLDEYKSCVDDVLDTQQDVFEALGTTGLCQVLTTTALSCPCWPDGIPYDVIFIDGFQHEGFAAGTRDGWMALNDPYGMFFSASAESNGSFTCKTENGGTGTTEMQISKDDFAKCYNDLLEKSFAHGKNECAKAAFL